MITSENKRLRLRQCIDAPKRLLRRARDLYIDSTVSIDRKLTGANYVVAWPTTNNLDRATTKQDDHRHLENRYKEFCRSITNRYNWGSTTTKEQPDKTCERVTRYRAFDRSYSVALGKIGTIDEEEPCDFQEHVVVKSDVLLPRSRSYASTGF